MNHHTPQSLRKTIQLMVILTILAWATQTLFHQWGYGAEAGDGVAADAAAGAPAAEKFVPGSRRYLAGSTLELRGEATVVGAEVKLRQVCRWSDADKPAFEPVADLVVLRMGGNVPFRAVGLDELKNTLHDAGVNLAVVKFAGATSCTINRADVHVDERDAMEQWINARQPQATAAAAPATMPAAAGEVAAQPASARVAAPVMARPVAAAADEPKTFKSLRDLLVADVCERLSVAPESLQMKFSPEDEKLLNLSEPHFRFNLVNHRVYNLGDVAWDVTVITDSGSHKATISANARAWQNQLVVNKPMGYRQVIRDEDLQDRHTLADRLPDGPAIVRGQAVGQMAAQELKPGTILTPRLIEATPLAKPGQTIMVTVQSGNVQIRTVAVAMDSGSYGQSIKVRNEASKDVFQVTLTGPQEGTMTPPRSPSPEPAAPAANIATLERN